jgi:hypothetical protein
MASPYTSQSASGYNASPPPDDGSEIASNQVLWATIKTKLADPAKNLADNINAAISDAFDVTISGASVSSQSTSYQVLSDDQGKLIRATASSITITTPSATTVSSPFVFAVLNNSGGNITLDGSDSQTVNGAANITLPDGQGVLVFTDGSNWFVIGCILSTADLTIADLTATTVTASGAVSGGSATGTMVATQTDQETGTSTSTLVSPGRQHFHTGHPKFVAFATVSAGTPTLQTPPSYNITSITDTGLGDLTITIATDFSGSTWAPLSNTDKTGTNADDDFYKGPAAAGSIEVVNLETGVSARDPISWSVIGFGDQA